MAGNHALVFGASGIQGWAITDQILKEYPNPTTFSRVTAVTKRDLPLNSTLWPQTGKLHAVHGIDLLTEEGQDGLERRMKAIYDIDTVTHVFFCAYIHDSDPAKECQLNKDLLVRAITAISRLSPALKFVVLPTGTKTYGVHLMDKFPFSDQLPLKESHPRVPEPHASVNFYYHQIDALNKLCEGKSWTWCEVRPDVIVGFVPNQNVFCLAQQYAIYLSIFAEVHGKGAECPWPGTLDTYNALSNDASQDVIAQFAIYASLAPQACGGGQAFNVADLSRPADWGERWVALCDYFGLVGIPPNPIPGLGWREFNENHQSTWDEMVKKYGLKGNATPGGPTSATVEGTMMYMDFDRTLDITKMLATGYRPPERPDTETAWYTAFDRFRQAKIIP